MANVLTDAGPCVALNTRYPVSVHTIFVRKLTLLKSDFQKNVFINIKVYNSYKAYLRAVPNICLFETTRKY